ncbi:MULTISPECIES: GNAT family N-acetyltransferase [unclassified Micromonospora]|uniref:GNAT family N-acetyltransferase n=1 Tax=unclassified Micromonospora TaxID=2617518 RepID=UPI003A8C3693
MRTISTPSRRPATGSGTRPDVAIAAELGHSRAVLDVGCYREDTATAGRRTELGFSVATVLNRLFVPHDAASPMADPGEPDAVRIRSTGDDLEVRHQAWTVHQAAFADHFGFAAKAYPDWVRHLESHSDHDWSLGEVAYLDGVPAAIVLRSHAFVADGQSGYMRLLAVRPEWQGRGLGRLLLRRAFAADVADQRRGTFPARRYRPPAAGAAPVPFRGHAAGADHRRLATDRPGDALTG